MISPRVVRHLWLGLAAVATAAGTAAAQALHESVVPLPAPAGPRPIGTTVAYLVDGARPAPDLPGGRPITLQLFYPATASARGEVAPYLMERGLAELLRRERYYMIDSASIAVWAGQSTHARRDAEPAAGRRPLVVLAAGLGVVRANYTAFAEDLASHGYVVALLDNPLLGVMVLPEGRVVVDTVNRDDDPAFFRGMVADWSRDVSFVLDRLQSERGTTPLARVAASIEWTQVGVAGHSAGGLVAVAACERDRRVRACVDMDGGVTAPDRQPLADFVTTGVRGPTLFLRSQPLYDDTTFARRGITREQWESRGVPEQSVFAEFAQRSVGPVWVARVAGTGHFSFSDAPFVMPWTITRFGGRIIDARRGLQVVTTLLRTFFDRELRGRGDGLDGLAGAVPELTVERAR